MTEQPEVRYLGDVQRLALAPDDIIVLRTHLLLSNDQASALREQISKQLGSERKVLVLTQGLEIGVLSPEPA